MMIESAEVESSESRQWCLMSSPTRPWIGRNAKMTA
jgi:hypothetical protein